MRKPTWARLVVLLAIFITIAGAAPADAQNGRLPGSALSPIASGNGCNQLANDAAGAWNTMGLYRGHFLATNGCVSAYRSYAQQVIFWNAYLNGGNLAARPGTSNHGWGKAADVPTDVQGFLRANGRKFGWAKIEAFSEPWHFNYTGGFGRPNPGTNLSLPVLRRGSGGPGQHEWVRRAQQRLRVHGFRVTTDGAFGLKTARAVRQFQAAAKLKDDGVIGANTWAKLKDAAGPVDDEPRPDPKPPATHGTPLGVDVSQHQPSIDWQKVESQGYDFAIVKSSEGADFRDPKFTQGRYDAIRRAKMARGVYHFLRPRTYRAGSVEADFFVKTIREGGYSFGDIRPVVDIETTDAGVDVCGYLRSFTRRVREQLDTKPIVYTYPSFAAQHLDDCGKWLGRHPLWIAHYGTQRPTVPKAWANYAIWQHSSSGRVGGIPGDVDLNKIPGGQKILDDLLYRKQTVTGGVAAP